MTTPPSPSWYDLLAVEPTAGPAEVRSAWKAAIADLEPTDRRFKTYTQAAEVLLDPVRRAEYDAALRLAGAPEPAPPAAGSPAEAPSTGVHPTEQRAPRAAGVVPLWLLAGLAVLTLVVAGAAGYLATTPSDTTVAESTQTAQSTAERAIVPILSYDHRTLDQDRAAAGEYLTPDYRDEYDQLFEVLAQNAPRTRTVVETEVVASGIVRSGEDRVEVLLFVNRPTTNRQQREPVIYKDHVRVQMEQVGDDWLVDCLITTPGAGCE